MVDEYKPGGNESRSFWGTTLGTITKITALLTAITGLILAVKPFIGGKSKGSTENTSPVANVGEDETITQPQNNVILDGSQSYDKETSIVSYLWEKESGPALYDLVDADKIKAKVKNLQAGEYVFKLTVTDSEGAKDTKSKKVIVTTASNAERVTKPWTLSEFGVWGQSKSGDNDMNTSPGDIVPVKCTTELIKTDSRITIRVTYSIREDGGDHTTFDNTIERPVFTAPAGKKIVDLIVKGGETLVTLEQESKDRNHAPTRFRNISGTYWKRLSFIVDGTGDDDKTIGLSGELGYTVVLEDI